MPAIARRLIAGFVMSQWLLGSAAAADNPAEAFELPAVEVIGTTPLPGLGVPLTSKPSVRQAASGSASFSTAATQSVGTTSKPTPGHTTIPAACASACLACAATKTSISPVISR